MVSASSSESMSALLRSIERIIRGRPIHRTGKGCQQRQQQGVQHVQAQAHRVMPRGRELFTACWTAMLTLFLGGVLLCWWAEARGNPIHLETG